MKLKVIPYFLTLFVASAWLDGAWAASTPDPDDDIIAAENNTYIAPPLPRPPPKPCQAADLATLSPIVLYNCIPYQHCQWNQWFLKAAGPPLVYVLMNLKR